MSTAKNAPKLKFRFFLSTDSGFLDTARAREFPESLKHPPSKARTDETAFFSDRGNTPLENPSPSQRRRARGYKIAVRRLLG